MHVVAKVIYFNWSSYFTLSSYFFNNGRNSNDSMAYQCQTQASYTTSSLCILTLILLSHSATVGFKLSYINWHALLIKTKMK